MTKKKKTEKRASHKLEPRRRERKESEPFWDFELGDLSGASEAMAL